MFARIKQVGRGIAATVNGKAAGLLAFLMVLSVQAAARADVTLPAMPIDIADYATAGLVVLGTVFTAIVGVILVYGLTRMGIRKLTGAFSGRS